MTSLLDYPVHVYSELGKGSCFMIEVPIVEAPKMVASPVQAVPLKPKLIKFYVWTMMKRFWKVWQRYSPNGVIKSLKPLNLNKL
jgi:hypothetical protein